MPTTKTTQIKCLDKGYVITRDGKDRAIENYRDIQEILKTELFALMERIHHFSVKGMIIELEVTENPPGISQ